MTERSRIPPLEHRRNDPSSIVIKLSSANTTSHSNSSIVAIQTRSVETRLLRTLRRVPLNNSFQRRLLHTSRTTTQSQLKHNTIHTMSTTTPSSASAPAPPKPTIDADPTPIPTTADKKKRSPRGKAPNRDVQVSKALSKLLRHDAEKHKLKLDEEGFAELDKVVSSTASLAHSA